MVDGQGVIRDVAFNKDELSLELDGHGRWLGSTFADIVTPDTRMKISELLRDALSKKPSGWRQVNHISASGQDIPVLYSAADIGRKDRFVFIGRDLRPLAVMQQRLIIAQQSMERDYTRLRHAETRYRLLFQVSQEGVMIVDATTHQIFEVNPAALALFDESAPQVLKSNLINHFDAEHVPNIRHLLADVRATGRDRSVHLQIAKTSRNCTLSASLFRQENASFFLLRFSTDAPLPESSDLIATSMLLRHFEDAPDGMVITHHDGRVVRANLSFLSMAQLTSEEQARGESLDRWIGRTNVDLSIAFANLRQGGAVKLFATVLHGEYGALTEIEMSAVSLLDSGDSPSFGFTIRNIDRRIAAADPAGRELPRSIAELTKLIGRVPLRDLVRETTDVIEKLSIEAALELTGNNRASAADMLGLSRQSLYVKLRRFGLAEHAPDDEVDDE